MRTFSIIVVGFAMLAIAAGQANNQQGAAAPSTGNVASSTGNAVPSTGNAVPSTGNAVPSTGNAAPSTGNAPGQPARTRRSRARSTQNLTPSAPPAQQAATTQAPPALQVPVGQVNNQPSPPQQAALAPSTGNAPNQQTPPAVPLQNSIPSAPFTPSGQVTRQRGVQRPSIRIPSPDSLNLKSNPITLGRQIARLSADKQDKFIEKLEDLIDKSGDSMQADFYETVLDAIESPAKASREWRKTLKEVTDYGKQMAQNIPGVDIDNLFNMNTPLATINEILDADPLGMAMKGVGGIMSQSFGNGLQMAAGLSDIGHNMAEATALGLQALTSPFNALPIAGPIKASIDKLILQQIRDGKEMANNVFMAGANSAKKIGERKTNEFNSGFQKLSSLPSMRRK